MIDSVRIATFLGKIDKRSGFGPANNCWRWTGATDPLGYGRVRIRLNSGRLVQLAHRFSWMLHNCDFTANGHVMHSCDNPSCVNPDHLKLGTHAENMADMAAKGRSPGKKGALSDRAKLTEDNAKEIISAMPLKHGQLTFFARKFSVNKSTVYCLVHGKTWTHLRRRNDA